MLGPKPLRIVVSLLAGLLVAAPAGAQTSIRPLDDWIAANQFAPDILWFDNGAPSPAPRAYFDLFGRTAAAFGLNLGTRFDGSIKETRLANGRARVSIVVHASHVMTYAVRLPGDLLFGHRASEIAAGEDAALADLLLTVDFENSAPGAPLPSLNALSFDRSNPDFHLERMGLVAHAVGTLRSAFGVTDGTPGVLRTTQRELVDAPGIRDNGTDLFPAEKVEIHVRP